MNPESNPPALDLSAPALQNPGGNGAGEQDSKFPPPSGDVITDRARQNGRATGGMPPNQSRPGAITTTIADGDGIAVAWDLLIESAQAIGIPATATKYNVSAQAIRTRVKRHKIKGIVDARTLAKGKQGNSEELATTPGDFSGRVASFREKVFKKADDSITKFKAKAPKSFKELDSASKIAERMMGIGDEGVKVGVLVHLNEAVDQHGEEMSQPIEAHVVEDATLLPVSPEPLQQGDT